MSVIEPDLKLEDLNYLKDKVIEKKEDSSFDIVTELRKKSDSLGTTTDSIKFATFCSLLADLIENPQSYGFPLEILETITVPDQSEAKEALIVVDGIYPYYLEENVLKPTEHLDTDTLYANTNALLKGDLLFHTMLTK